MDSMCSLDSLSTISTWTSSSVEDETYEEFEDTPLSQIISCSHDSEWSGQDKVQWWLDNYYHYHHPKLSFSQYDLGCIPSPSSSQPMQGNSWDDEEDSDESSSFSHYGQGSDTDTASSDEDMMDTAPPPLQGEITAFKKTPRMDEQKRNALLKIFGRKLQQKNR